MKKLVYFAMNKINTNNLRFHYLRIGKASKLLDRIRDNTADKEIEWIQYESSTFKEFYFGENYKKFDGAIVNLAINDDNLSSVRRDFWENFIWKTQNYPLVIALVIPDTTQFGTLTRSQVMEGLSLIRLTDRPFEIFENKTGIEEEITSWLSRMTAIVHKKERMNEETDSE